MSEDKVEKKQEKSGKLDRTKKVVKKYWIPITIGVVCITVTYIVTRRVTLRNMPEVIEGVSIDFFNKPTHDLVEVAIPKVFNGMQGKAVFNPKTRVGYFSQRLAAQAHEVTDAIVSDHLQGVYPDVKGETLQRANFRIFAEVEK